MRVEKYIAAIRDTDDPRHVRQWQVFGLIITVKTGPMKSATRGQA